jgi:hypothetical protein
LREANLKRFFHGYCSAKNDPSGRVVEREAALTANATDISMAARAFAK